MKHIDNEKFARKILKTRGAIRIDNALMRGLGYEDTREFFKQLGDWGYTTDFGRFSEAADTRVDSYVRHFIRDCFID